MARVDVQLVGFENAIVRLNSIGTVNQQGIMAAAAETIRKQTLRRFGAKIAPDGQSWAPRKQTQMRGRSAAAKHIRAGSSSLLVDTGRLRNSIASKVYGFVAEVGTNVSYARYHQYGTKKMTARPFLGFGDADAKEIEQVIQRYVASGLA